MKKILIIGSCVSRDAFEFFDASQFSLVDYVARSSLASAFSVLPFSGVDLGNIASAFQRRMVETDLCKGLESIIRNSEFDYILLDAIDERFDIFKSDVGEICTLSGELKLSGYFSDGNNKAGKIISSGTSDFLFLWEQGWKRLINLLWELGAIEKLFVNGVYWSSCLEDGSSFDSVYTESYIEMANSFLAEIYSIMRRDLKESQIIGFSQNDLRGSTQHRWGVSPFHYTPNVYQEIARTVSDIGKTSRASWEKNVDIHDVVLSSDIQWLEISVPEPCRVVIEAGVTGSVGVSEREALICLDYPGVLGHLPDGFVLSQDQAVGVYHYLKTGHGSFRTFISFDVNCGGSALKIGFRSWWPIGEVKLDYFRVFF